MLGSRRGPCRIVAPIMDNLAKKYKGTVAFETLKSNENLTTTNRFGIMAIPTMPGSQEGHLIDQIGFSFQVVSKSQVLLLRL